MTPKQKRRQRKRFDFVEKILKQLSYNAWPNPELRALKKRIARIEQKVSLTSK